MGCAQETFGAMLNFLHKEYVDPNYLETYLQGDKNTKFELDNKLEDTGCTPKCAAHLTFGLETIDLTSCSKCEHVDEVSSSKTDYLQ